MRNYASTVREWRHYKLVEAHCQCTNSNKQQRMQPTYHGFNVSII